MWIVSASPCSPLTISDLTSCAVNCTSTADTRLQALASLWATSSPAPLSKLVLLSSPFRLAIRSWPLSQHPGTSPIALLCLLARFVDAASGVCFYCLNGATARCVETQLFGCEDLDGGQAEYVRVPLADGTVVKAPDTISDQALLLMADIFPTGYFGVKSAIEMCPSQDIRQSTLVVVGCGPVGLCAILAAAHRQPRHLFAIDSVDSRLELARQLGAEPLNFQTDKERMVARIKEVTEGRGADMVVEVVGQAPALKTAFDLVRNFGAISSIGVHSTEVCQWFSIL